jgi:hypothetical protein
MTHARTALALAMMMAGDAIPSSPTKVFDPVPEVPEKTTYEMKRIEKAQLKRDRRKLFNLTKKEK